MSCAEVQEYIYPEPDTEIKILNICLPATDLLLSKFFFKKPVPSRPETLLRTLAVGGNIKQQ
jgi:hypothetical protein